MPNEFNNLYEFGGFRFDGGTHRLWRDGELTLLSPKASGLLRMLLERQGGFVLKEEIFETVWADTFVEDGVLTQNIYTLRKALGTDENGSPIIENKARLGYRITIPVTVGEETGRILTVPNMPDAAEGATQKRRWQIVGLSAVAIATIGILGFLYFRNPPVEERRISLESVRFEAITDTGDITEPVISRDGEFAAFVRGKNIFLKDLKSRREIKLEIPGVTSFSSLQFSADGSSIFFRPHNTLRKDENILRVPRFGGETHLIAEKTWGSFGVSNDGKKIAYGRNYAKETNQALVVKDIESGDEREIAKFGWPEMFLHNSSPVWSPDDRFIVYVAQNYMARRTAMYKVDLQTGEKMEIKASNLQQYEQIAFLPDGKNLIASASEGGKFFHLWKITPGAEKASRLTNGLSSFGEISLSTDGQKALVLQTTESSNIFIAEAENLLDQQQVTFGNANNIGQSALDWIDEKSLVYVAYSQENPMANIWRFDVNDRTSKALTANRDYHSDAPSATPDGSRIYFTVTETPFVNIREIDGNGGGRKQITEGKDGFRIFPQVTSDGRYLYYIFRSSGGGDIIRRDLTDNSEVVLLARPAANPVGKLALSANGKRLTFVNWANYAGDNSDRTNFQLGVVSTDDPTDLRFFSVRLLVAAIQMTPDGEAFDYLSFDEDRNMLLRQSIDGGPPKELLTIPNRRIYNFAWSKSGHRIAIAHGIQQRDAVLLTNIE